MSVGGRMEGTEKEAEHGFGRKINGEDGRFQAWLYYNLMMIDNFTILC
jgi:hypothetical protein